ncbi:hypothetical protein FE257_010853 [Aspergillus nanangensis]|uniref:F-box domain-containing protein n=1 Tax=Aspergillus nanangensis TaxID=2582783 RepID=A0AAD4CVZ1_ASPNN|nr:hypothetical protein FE257_010853 [Aspergillus nanangensis]
MALQDLPPEVSSLILGELFEHRNPHLDESRDNVQHICTARLVCREWNSLAAVHLFRSIILAYTDEEFKCWNGILDSPTRVINHARNVFIRTAPLDDHPEGIWNAWEEDVYNALLNATGRIAELENIDSLHLRFSRHCAGSEDEYPRDDVVETIALRQQMLDSVFKAMQQRYGNSGRSGRPIHSLTIENLQNLPLPEFTSSSLFKEVTEHVNHLHLMVAEEDNEAGPDWDMYKVERREFEPSLHRQWLQPLSDHLVSLTLYFRTCWGSIPGYFDGEGLIFPKLKTLNLGNFVIGHHRQFDWVLNQPSLTSLRLDKCSIVSHISISRENVDDWHVRTHDWDEYPEGSFGIYEGYMMYGFPGTWETIFDDIRTSLPNLTDFRFQNDDYSLVFPVRLELLSCELSKKRYIGFDISDWIEACVDSGEVEFGGFPDASFNRSEETALGDESALSALQQAIRMRWEH